MKLKTVKTYWLSIPAALAGGVALCALSGCQPSGASNVATAAVAPHVQIARARQGEIVRSIRLPANIRAYQEAMLYAKVPGYLKSIAVDRGDWVKANDVLAEIEAPEMLADVTKFKAELDVAKVD